MAASIDSILESIAAAGNAYQSHDLGSRESLIELGRNLVAALEIPSEFLQRTFWAEPALSAHCKLAVDIKLFQHLRDAGTTGVSPDDLAQKTSVDKVFLSRILRHLIAMKVVSFGRGRFFGTPLSNGLAAKNYQTSIDFCYGVVRPCFNAFPNFFKKTDYKLPTAEACPLQAAHNTDLAFFPWIMATPPHFLEYNAFMSAYRAGKAAWCHPGFYPVAERLFQGFDASNNDAVLVDVGGNRGHDLELFAAQHDTHPGILILQDRPPVIDSIQNKEKLQFECQPTDFFTLQPVKGARAYFLHSVLHDWPDEECIVILENLKPALKPGYSRVLLDEIVVSEENPTLAVSSMDMMMMAHHGVRERTESEWRAIIGKAGLKVSSIHPYPGVAESVIEAEL